MRSVGKPRGHVAPEVRIRGARLDDWAAVCALLRAVEDIHSRIWPTFFRRGGGPAWTRERLRAVVSAHDEVLLLAECGGQAIGLVHATLFDTPEEPALVPTRRMHVDDLVVAEGARRRGLGRRLVRAAEDWGRRQGCAQCVLTVWEGNAAAERFYDALRYRCLNRVLIREL